RITCRLMRIAHRSCFLFFNILPPPTSPLFPYTTLFRSHPALPVKHPCSDPLLPLALDPLDDLPAKQAVRADEDGEENHHRGHHRSEEHTSELQSRENLVCRLLLEKKKKKKKKDRSGTLY